MLFANIYGSSRDFIKDENNHTIYSPLKGKVIPLEEVNDFVFSNHMLGEGLAIIPNANELYSPISGVIKTIFPTKHAIGIENDDGVEVIIHVGIDTVELKGKYFDCIVKENERVNAGQLLMKVDFKKIEKERYETTTIVVISNKDKFLIILNHLLNFNINEKDPLFEFKRI